MLCLGFLECFIICIYYSFLIQTIDRAAPVVFVPIHELAIMHLERNVEVSAELSVSLM